MHVSSQLSNFLPKEGTPWLVQGKEMFPSKKQCQDKEQLILTILSMLTRQYSEKQCRSSQGKAGEAQCQQKQFIKFENIKLIFLETHPAVDP